MSPPDEDETDTRAATSLGTEASDALGSLESVFRALAEAPGTPPLLPGGRLLGGKYAVERILGQGGMGVVYLARDDRLERQVAVKLGTAVSATALERLEREAKALAKLSHPNVVVIYEVGELDGHLFVAMEYVSAGTARRWVAEEPRSARAIVDLYAAAGDGLAAAHDAGILHRDFKPDNVLVGDDGRPRVADFGLARDLDGAPASAEPAARIEEPAASESLSRLTAEGAAVGTMPYMAPEQLSASPLDARADQFAFCASLWEALFRVRPFAGRSRDELLAAIERGAPQLARATAPRHVVEALRVGLRFDPAARWPSMRELLAELRRDPLARWRRAGLTAMAVLGVLSVVTIARLARRHEDPCGGGEARASKVWSRERAGALERAFSGAGSSALFTTLRTSIDDYEKTWIVAERDACRATRVVGTQSEAILDRRMLCLRGAQAQLDGVLEEAAAHPREVAERAARALSALPDLASCADVAALGSQPPLPADAGIRRQIEALQDQLADIRTRYFLREAPLSVAEIDGALAAAQKLGWRPLVAEASYARALALLEHDVEGGRAALEETVYAALAGGADELAAHASAALASSLASGGHADAARRWLRLGQAENTRAGDLPMIGGNLANVEAELLQTSPHPADALAVRRRQVELARRARQSPIDEADNHLNLAVGLVAAGQFDEAAAESALATQQITAAVGADQPTLITFQSMSARIAIQRGRLDEAEALTRSSLRISEAWFGPDTARTAGVLQTLGAILQRRGDLTGFAAVTARALAIVDRVEARSPEAGELQANAALLAFTRGDTDEAARRAARATTILEAAWGKDSPRLIDLLLVRANVSRAQRRLDESEALLRRAMELADAAGERPIP